MIASVLEVKNEIPTLGTTDGAFQPWGREVKGIGVFLLLVASFCEGQFKHSSLSPSQGLVADSYWSNYGSDVFCSTISSFIQRNAK